MKKIRSLIDKSLSKFTKTLLVMRKARKKVKGPMIGIEKTQQKLKLRAMVSHWKAIVRKKLGKFVSREKI